MTVYPSPSQITVKLNISFKRIDKFCKQKRNRRIGHTNHKKRVLATSGKTDNHRTFYSTRRRPMSIPCRTTGKCAAAYRLPERVQQKGTINFFESNADSLNRTPPH